MVKRGGPSWWYAAGKNGMFGPHSAMVQKRKLPNPEPRLVREPRDDPAGRQRRAPGR